MADAQKHFGISAAIWAAAIAVCGNALGSLVTAENQQVLQSREFEAERILQAIRTGDPDASAANLHFLLKARLITDPATVQGIVDYLTTREEGEGVFLPTDAPPTERVERPNSLSLVTEEEGNLLLEQFGIQGEEEIRPLTPRWVTRGTGNAR